MLNNKKILLVEDESDYRVALKMRLEAAGYQVIEAEDGLKALDMARNQSPDLIILDIMLPKMDGYKVCRFLKFDEKHKHIPVVMLTARSQVSDCETGEAVGANAYLTKPCKPSLMMETLSGLLGQ